MGSRSTQVIGLNEAARQLVAASEIPFCTEEGQRIYPDGRREPFSRAVTRPSVRREPSRREFIGMFDESYPLMRYVLADGRVLYEDVQACPWSAGPCFFLALREHAPDGEWVAASLWPQEEIDLC